MRVTNNMLSYNFLTSLNKSLERQNEIQEQLSDGKAIHRASDDPVKAVRSLRFNTNLSLNDQYTQNVKDARSWMDTTDSAMSDFSSLLIHAKELVVSADGTKPADALNAVGEELDGVINQMITVANTKIGDRYIFAGQNDKEQPFTRNGNDINYTGDNYKISMRISPGQATPSEDSINITGAELFGDGQEILHQLIDIKNELLKTSPDVSTLSSAGIQNIDDAHSYMLQKQTELGARSSAYEMAENMLDENNITITGDISDNEDLDVAKAYIDFKTSESVYKSALAVGARIMPTSLVDFLS